MNKFIRFRGNGYYYDVYNDDAYIISNIMGYKLWEKNGVVVTGFPSDLLNEVLTYLNKYKISYMVDKKLKDFGSINQYRRFIERSLPVNTVVDNRKDIFYGNFCVMFDDDLEETFEIDKDVSSDSEIVKLVFENEVGSINVLKSGEKFKIIDKNVSKR